MYFGDFKFTIGIFVILKVLRLFWSC